MIKLKHVAMVSALGVMQACSTVEIEEPPVTDISVVAVQPVIETASVISTGDAADDPAIYLRPDNPAASYIISTDKKSGLYLYNLDGSVKQYLPVGRLNNVDVRPNITATDKASQIAVATNRSNDTITFFHLDADGATQFASYPTIREEPYGVCLGVINDQYLTVVPHKTGHADVYVSSLSANQKIMETTHLQTLVLGTQMEGCVFDEANKMLYVGEEEAGISRFSILSGNGAIKLEERFIVDEINGATGIVADIEGLSIYRTGEKTGYLVASSQGNNTYALYDRQSNEFLLRFRIADNDSLDIDGTEETDGLDVTSAALPGFPKGILVVQDGFNKGPDTRQNFKIIDWRDVETLLAR